MYLRITERQNRDGSTVSYYALAENAWNATAKRAEARVVHNFGRADQVDRAALQRLVNNINRVLDAGEGLARGTQAIPEIDIDKVFELRRRAHCPSPMGGTWYRPGNPRLRRTRSSHSAAPDRAVRDGRQPPRGPELEAGLRRTLVA